MRRCEPVRRWVPRSRRRVAWELPHARIERVERTWGRVAWSLLAIAGWYFPVRVAWGPGWLCMAAALVVAAAWAVSLVRAAVRH